MTSYRCPKCGVGEDEPHIGCFGTRKPVDEFCPLCGATIGKNSEFCSVCRAAYIRRIRNPRKRAYAQAYAEGRIDYADHLPGVELGMMARQAVCMEIDRLRRARA